MAVTIPIEIGDVIYSGKFKNKKTKVKEISTDKYGHPTVNGKSMLTFRLEKALPKKESKIAEEILSSITAGGKTKREINQWLKKNIPFHVRVTEMRIDQVTIGAESGKDLHQLSNKIKNELKAKSVYKSGHENYLTLNF